MRSGEWLFTLATAARSPFRSCAAPSPTTSQYVEARCVRVSLFARTRRARDARVVARASRERAARGTIAGKSSPATRGCPDGRRSARRLRDEATLRRSRADATTQCIVPASPTASAARPRRRAPAGVARPLRHSRRRLRGFPHSTPCGVARRPRERQQRRRTTRRRGRSRVPPRDARPSSSSSARPAPASRRAAPAKPRARRVRVFRVSLRATHPRWCNIPSARPERFTDSPFSFSLSPRSRRGRSLFRHQVQDVHRVPRRRRDELRGQHRREEPVRHLREALGCPP